MEADDAMRLSTRLANAFVLDLVKLGAHGRDVMDPLIRSALLHASVATVMKDQALQLQYATFDRDVPNELRRPTSLNALANSLSLPFESVRRHVHALEAEGVCLPSGRGYVVPQAVTSSPFFQMACHVQHAKLLGLYGQLLAAGVVDDQPVTPRDWTEPPLRLAGRYVVEFVLRYRELIAAPLPDLVPSIVFMETLAINVEGLPLEGDGGLGEGFDDGERTPARTPRIAERLGVPGETVRRQLIALAEQGFLVRRGHGYLVPGALMETQTFQTLCAETHRNLMRLFGQLAAYDALRPVEAPPAIQAQAG